MTSISKVTYYQTSDGQTFPTVNEAIVQERKIIIERVLKSKSKAKFDEATYILIESIFDELVICFHKEGLLTEGFDISSIDILTNLAKMKRTVRADK